MPGYLVLPDKSGHCRIASYDGKSPLSAWLTTVINNKAFNERRDCRDECLDSVPDIVDEAELGRIQAAVRANKYELIIRQSLKVPCQSLNESERLMMLMRYEQGLQTPEIARILEVHKSTVSRHLQQAQRKLKMEILTRLREDHKLSDCEIEECLEDLFENPAHSILELIRAC